MGRKEELHVNVPSFFRCPISLDVMKSPVSLCTGVTYDRSSIQRWLEAGNNTCPATMQVLPTAELVPNHTLHRLIQTWSRPTTKTNGDASLSLHYRAGNIIRELESSTDPVPSLRELASITKESEAIDELINVDGLVSVLSSVLAREGCQQLEVVELVVGIMAFLLNRNSESSNLDIIRTMASASTISSLLTLISNSRSPEPIINAVGILERISSIDVETKLLVARTKGILPVLVSLVTEEESEPSATDAALSCLMTLSSPRRIRSQIVRLGLIPALGKLLPSPSISASTAGKILKLLEMASTCTEGRAAICDEASTVLAATVGRMMKVSPAATEHALVVLWSVCHLFRDQRAQDAVAGSNGLTKILLLMQSNCSPAARQMAMDLLMLFTAYNKGCLGSYDTKTTHIMPF